MTDLTPKKALGLPARRVEWMPEPARLLHLVQSAEAALPDTTLHEALQTRAFADSVSYAVRQAKLGVKLENDAIQCRLRAERRAGELLIEMRERGERDRGQGGDRRSESQLATVKLRDLGLTRSQSSRLQQIARIPQDVFDRWLDKLRGGQTSRMTTTALFQFARREKAEAQRRAAASSVGIVTRGDVKLHHCSAAELEVPLGAASLVLTDPPWDRASIQVWSDLADVAARALRPGALLVAVSGHAAMLDAADALRARLQFAWVISVIHDDGRRQPVVMPWRVLPRFRPALVFVKPPFSPKTIENWDDVFRTANPEKDFHPHQQPLGFFTYIISRFSQPGDLVVDPFLGSGTTSVAALTLGRRFLGCDVDAGALMQTRDRIEREAALERKGDQAR
jgi:hypothetical protein